MWEKEKYMVPLGLSSLRLDPLLVPLWQPLAQLQQGRSLLFTPSWLLQSCSFAQAVQARSDISLLCNSTLTVAVQPVLTHRALQSQLCDLKSSRACIRHHVKERCCFFLSPRCMMFPRQCSTLAMVERSCTPIISFDWGKERAEAPHHMTILPTFIFN